MSPDAARRWWLLYGNAGTSSSSPVSCSMVLLPDLKPGPILELVPSSVRELSPEGRIETDDEKKVLGGEEIADPEPIDQAELSPAAVPDLSDLLALKIEPPESSDPLALKFETKACGWIGWKESKRERKRRDPWVGRQAWLYWEEPGGKKRSRYIPKAKLAAVEESVYGLKRPIYETLELLGGKK